MITPQNLTKHELIGLKVEVVDSRNKTNVGLKGVVVDETQKTLVIGKEKKRIFKNHVTFEFTLPKNKVRVQGHVLVGRPWDRIKKA